MCELLEIFAVVRDQERDTLVELTVDQGLEEPLAEYHVLLGSHAFRKLRPEDGKCGQQEAEQHRNPGHFNADARAGLSPDDLIAAEIMEAYAVQAMACAKEVGISPSITNLGGGSLSRGHPIGASGAVLAVRLHHELKHRHGSGLAAIAAAGGLGTALLLESVSEPFAVAAVQEDRRRIRANIANLIGSRSCHRAWEAYEPWIPWRLEHLNARMRCYTMVGHPLAEQATRDVATFLRDQETTFSDGL